MNKIKGIEVNWLNFGYGKHEKKPQWLVIENYTLSSNNISKRTVKSICNTKFLSNFLKYTNVHHFSYRFSIIDIVTKLSFGYPKLFKGKDANDVLQLNHYITKSKEEYLTKMKVNSDGWMPGKESEEKFWNLNHGLDSIWIALRPASFVGFPISG